MTPDFTKLPYGFSEFPKATLAAWTAAAGKTEPWLAPEGFAHRDAQLARHEPGGVMDNAASFRFHL